MAPEWIAPLRPVSPTSKSLAGDRSARLGRGRARAGVPSTSSMRSHPRRLPRHAASVTKWKGQRSLKLGGLAPHQMIRRTFGSPAGTPGRAEEGFSGSPCS